jgi:hypothetical protein
MKQDVAVVTYVFDVWTRVNGDDVAMLDTEVAADNTVDTGASIIKIIVCKHDQDCIFSLFALDKNCVSSKEL